MRIVTVSGASRQVKLDDPLSQGVDGLKVLCPPQLEVAICDFKLDIPIWHIKKANLATSNHF